MLNGKRTSNDLKGLTKGILKVKQVLSPGVEIIITDSWIYSNYSDYVLQITAEGIAFTIDITPYAITDTLSMSEENFYYNQIITKAFQVWSSILLDFDKLSGQNQCSD